jgi:hypothetical protein
MSDIVLRNQNPLSVTVERDRPTLLERIGIVSDGHRRHQRRLDRIVDDAEATAVAVRAGGIVKRVQIDAETAVRMAELESRGQITARELEIHSEDQEARLRTVIEEARRFENFRSALATSGLGPDLVRTVLHRAAVDFDRRARELLGDDNPFAGALDGAKRPRQRRGDRSPNTRRSQK